MSRVATLGAASIFDYGIQLILPIILVRVLVDQDYAKYRMLFLLVNTAMALAPLYMPQALFYFLPRASSKQQRASYIANTLFFMYLTGFIAAVLLNPWYPLISEQFFTITDKQILIPAFIMMWIIASLIDSLPNASNLIRWQALISIAISTARVITIAATAWFTNDIEAVFSMLCLFVSLKALLLLIFIKVQHPDVRLSIEFCLMKMQVRYALPFGLSSMFYMLKVQSDQWIAAYLFTPLMYAVFSFGIYIAPLMTLLRNAINNAALPSMSAAYANGDIGSVLDQFRRVNLMMALLILPVLASLFAAADRVIIFLFTETYREAANVMQIYIIGFVAQCLESTTLLRLASAGKTVMKLNATLLPFAILISFIGGSLWDLPGAALGSVATLYAGELFNLWYSSHLMQTRLRKIINWRTWSILLIAALIAVITGKLVAHTINFSPLYDTIVIAATCLSVYTLLVILAKLSKVISLDNLRGIQ
ncbi:MAG TPA: hypothetical protein DCZ48_13955 [Methylococcaceae bacterium]|nr:hypothetical protein [Methylococcaceae bacterium]